MPDESGPPKSRFRALAAALCTPVLFFSAALGAQSANPPANTPANQSAAQTAAPAANSAAQPANANPAPAATPNAPADPIAIVPLADAKSGAGATVTGALEVTSGKAILFSSGTVTSGSQTTDVLLPRRGTLHVCTATSVKLAADSSVPAGGSPPGLLMALDHGALEASFATGRNADILLTPDFRILISGPGSANLKIRLGEHGDTCVDNPLVQGTAPYVLVTSVFDGSVYRVQPGQRVMFQHGSTHEVVDNEKEPCGCPAPIAPGTNEFPMAESAGLAPLSAQAPRFPAPSNSPIVAPLIYKSPAAAPVPEPAVTAPSAPVAASSPAAQPQTAKPKAHPGFFHSIGRFFRRLFGAD
ncbi:MAG: hypothetical protein WBD67_01325 [Terracidiphilus sp.]